MTGRHQYSQRRSNNNNRQHSRTGEPFNSDERWTLPARKLLPCPSRYGDERTPTNDIYWRSGTSTGSYSRWLDGGHRLRPHELDYLPDPLLFVHNSTWRRKPTTVINSKACWNYMNCDHRRCTRSVNTISSFTVHLRCTAWTFTSTVHSSVVVRAAHATSSFTVHSSSTCTAFTVILSSTVMHGTYVWVSFLRASADMHGTYC